PALSLRLPVPLLRWVVDRLARRLRSLEQVARRLAGGDAGARAREQPEDEIGRLGWALNRMSSESRARLAELERERDERERILSHLTDGIALIDAQGLTSRANDRLAELLRLAQP